MKQTLVRGRQAGERSQQIPPLKITKKVNEMLPNQEIPKDKPTEQKETPKHGDDDCDDKYDVMISYNHNHKEPLTRFVIIYEKKRILKSGLMLSK